MTDVDNSYTDEIQDFRTDALGKVVGRLDTSPDQGARVLQLSRATGVHPELIDQDVEGFEQEHKANLATQIVAGNAHLQSYIRGNPMADTVSNDDYGNLDNFSQKASVLSQIHRVISPQKLIEPLAAGVEGAITGAYEGFTAPVHKQEEIDKLKETAPYSWAAWQALSIPVRGITALAEGTFGAASEFAGKLAENLGYDESSVGMAKREARGIVESEMGRGGDHGADIVRHGQMRKAREELAAKVAEIYDAAKPWTDAGIEPPRGVHPLIDQAKEQINAEFVKQLQDVLTESEGSATKARDPELFSKFVEEHSLDGTIGISGDRIAELYGDKVPHPEDGLLGWVPGIEDKLAVAKATGEDVHVPIKDWLSKVDPALAKDLGDDIRAWPGGITKTEAKEPFEPKPVVDSPLAQVRAVNGLEPVYALGDRKLELKRLPADKGAEEFHNFAFVDENGKEIGHLEILPDPAKKQLYVANITGSAGLYSNSFGPSLIRDLKRQLKAMYPEYETITGHRVSGARYSAREIERKAAAKAAEDGFDFKQLSAEQADKYYSWAESRTDNATDHPVVKLSLDEIEDGQLGQLLDGMYKQQFSHGISAYMIPKRMWMEHEHTINRAVQDVLRQMVGEGAEVIGTHGIEHASGAANIRGVFLDDARNVPKILFDLMDPEAVGIARHEGIHYLYRAGLFTDAEWSALLKASEENKWRERYDIDHRYRDQGLTEAELHEEAIAEAYREWAKTKDQVSHPDSLVTMAFQKIADLLDAIRERVKELLPWGGDVHDLFERVDSGEVAKRAGEGREAGPKFALDESDYQVKLDNLRAESAGLDLKSWRKMQKLIQERFAEDLDAAHKRAEKEQKTLQTKEWKENAKEIRKSVAESIEQRPDVAADLFVGGGQINGHQLEKRRYPLRADDLTPEQQASLPRHYYSKEGLPVDAVANMLGFHSGDELVRSLSEYNAQKEGRSVQEQLKKVTDDEVQRQMEAQFGKLNENIMSEARDQALSETNLNILAEEWQGAAMQAGVQVVDKDFAKATAQQLFSGMKVGEVSRDRLMVQLAKHGRDAERALIAGDPAKAVVHMERKYLTGLMAAEAMKLEKEMKRFDKTAKQFSKREVPSVEAEYTNFIHDILQRVGKPVRRSIQDIQKEIGAGYAKSLEDFVTYKEQQLRVMPVWEDLFDPNWRKDVKEQTVDEFRAVKQSVDTLVHNGRDEKKIIKAGEAAEFDEVKAQLIDGIVGSAHGHVATEMRGKLAKLPMTYYINHLQMENIMGRWDRFDPKGPWFQYVLRELIDGVNQGDVWRTEYAKKLNALGTPENIGRTMPNDIFKSPVTGATLPFTRKNLLTVMLNSGNDYNFNRMAKGYGLDPGEVMTWITKHATPEEWKWVQGVWDVYRDIKDKSDTMYRSLSGGMAPKDVLVRPVVDANGRQVAKGGYYPIIFHPEFEGTSRKLMGGDVLMMNNYTNTLPTNAYTKERTGYVAPLALEMDMMTNRLAQEIHDTATRPAIINAQKVFTDKEIRTAIQKHFGVEFKDELMDYLRSVANSQNYIPKNQQALMKAGEFIRQNVISTLVGFNPGTVMKHGPTAAILSAKEVGFLQFGKAFGEVAADSFMHWTKAMFGLNDNLAESNWQFAIKNSLELQRRDRNWQESLYGVEAGLTPGEKMAPWRQRIIQWGSKPVAMSDMISAVPTWLAKYHEEIANGADHGDAVSQADKSVRRAHGSTAATNRTGFQRNWSPWLTSIYNFWSEVMNRQVETIWKAGEAAKETDGGALKKGLATVPVLAGGMFAYAIWPAIVESFVSPEEHKHDEGWAAKAAKQLAFTLGSSWVGVRDFAAALTHGRDPQFGLTGTAYTHFSNAVRDFSKEDAFSREKRGKFLQDAGSFIGAATGMLPDAVSKVARFGHDVYVGKEHPQNVWQWLVGARYGTTKNHSRSFENYMEGRYK